jgi:hypothetical protein
VAGIAETLLLPGIALAVFTLVACENGRPAPRHETRVTPVRPVTGADEGGLRTDLDAEALLHELGCGRAPEGSVRQAACRLVRDFGRAGDVDALPPTDQATWFGQAFVLLGAEAEWREFYFLQVRPGRGQGRAVGKASMEYSVAARALIPEGAPQTAEAETLLGAVRSHSPPPAQNAAARFVKTMPPEDGFHGLGRTRGPSLYFDQFARAHFMRQSGARLLILERQPGETCAVELWPLG